MCFGFNSEEEEEEESRDFVSELRIIQRQGTGHQEKESSTSVVPSQHKERRYDGYAGRNVISRNSIING